MANARANPGDYGSGIKTTVYSGGEAIGIKYEGQFQSFANGPILSSSWDKTDTTSKRTPTKENTDSKRNDEIKALRLIPFEKLDTEQTYAEGGGTAPIAFGLRENGAGGVWVNPLLLDTASINFEQYFVYLISYGQIDMASTRARDVYFGKYNYRDTTFGTTIALTGYFYTSNPAVCPLVSAGVNCNHSTMRYLVDPLDIEIGKTISVEAIGQYVTEIQVRAKPILDDSSTPPIGSSFNTYTLKVYATDNGSGTKTSLGTFNTTSDGSIATFTASLTADNYTITVENFAALSTSGVDPDNIFLEFKQTSTSPTSLDRTSSYANLQMVGYSGNLYDPLVEYSPATGLKQLHIYLRKGVNVVRWRLTSVGGTLSSTTGPSNKFADLVFFWFAESGKFPATSQLVYFNYSQAAECTLFHEQYNITYNAYLTSTTNFLSYVQATAPLLLCSFVAVSGFFTLKPLLPINVNGQIDLTALTPEESYTDNDLAADSVLTSIIAGSYTKTYKNNEALLPVTVIVTWRDQAEYNIESSRTTTVRYSDTAADTPEEIYDLAEFCTNADHAEIFAKYVLAVRRYSLHTISFQTARNASFLEPLDLISVSMTRTNSAGDSRVETDHYLVDSLEYDQTGIVTINATHFPLNGSSISIISDSVLNGSFVVTT